MHTHTHTFLRPPCVAYKLASLGTCTGTGTWIESKAGCEAAAARLGLTHGVADNTHTANPYGCYYKKSANLLYFNPSGNKNDDDRDRVSVCRRKCDRV